MALPRSASPPRFAAGALLAAVVGAAALAVALWLFPRAMPIVALEHRITREQALARADSIFRIHGLASGAARTAVRFRADDSLRTFVELAGGGHDSLAALVRGRDVALFSWRVRAFTPGDPREARVELGADGRFLGFERRLAEGDARPLIGADSARRLADVVLAEWLGEPPARWRLAATAYDVKKTSGRTDRTFTYERTDRRIARAPLRLEVVVAGDLPAGARQFAEIPESFRRRYGEMRSANDLLALLAALGMLAIAIAALFALNRYARAGLVRWRQPAVISSVVGVLFVLDALNEIPGGWFGYDTATSPAAFQLMMLAGALAAGAGAALLLGLTLAAAEVATRQAFPHHLDWWKLWRYRGTRDVAARIGGGYVTACIAFAYVALFYLLARRLFGWWVPSELLDDPNQIASPMPWISGITQSLFAGVWEESAFRAIPLSLFSLWVGPRRHRRWYLALGVVVTSVVFGFGHSNYTSWPAYSRGVEIFLDACFWAVLFINFGWIVTVVAHFAYDLVLFGLFAASGSATPYRVAAGIIVLALLAPALAVLSKWIRQRALPPAPDDARFAAWLPAPRELPVAPPAAERAHLLAPRSRQLAMAVLVLAVALTAAKGPRPPLGPAFTATRATALATADSLLRDRGADPSRWTRLASIGNDTLGGWRRFLVKYDLASRAQQLARGVAPPAWWVVRYVHTSGTPADRAEEWRVRVRPDGRPLDVRHILPDSAARDSVPATEARRIARLALARAGLDTSRLVEAQLTETARPARRDVTVTYVDAATPLPAGAQARAFVSIAGSEPLVARRTIELPESFLRAERQRQTNRALVIGLASLLLFGGVSVGAVVVVRRRPPLLSDGALSRRTTIVLLAVATVLGLAQWLDGLPSRLFSYDTAEPWSRFLGTAWLGIASVPVMALAALGAWLLMSALRRRTGIPMLPAAPSRATRNDVLLAGAGLGATIHAFAALRSFGPATGLPRAPTTQLELALPWLGGVAGLPLATVMGVALVAIPLLVIVTVTRRTWVRLLLGAVALLLVVLIGMLAADARAGSTGVVAVTGTVAAAVALWLALRYWGAVSAWSWVVAALALSSLGGLSRAMFAPTREERIAGLVTMLVACALTAMVGRTASRGEPGTNPGARPDRDRVPE